MFTLFQLTSPERASFESYSLYGSIREQSSCGSYAGESCTSLIPSEILATMGSLSYGAATTVLLSVRVKASV